MVSVGQVLGGLAVGALGASLGRKNTVLASCLPNFIGWVVLFSLPSLEFAILGRFLTGIGMGMEGAIHSVYVCELVSPRWRGSMTASGIVVITAGILASYLVGTILYWRVRYENESCSRIHGVRSSFLWGQVALRNMSAPWNQLLSMMRLFGLFLSYSSLFQTAAVTFCAFPVLTAFAVLFIPESPIYLIEKGRMDKAKRSLRWLGRVEFGAAHQVRYFHHFVFFWHHFRGLKSLTVFL